MSAEFNGYADADYEIDEGDCVKGDGEEGHGADDVGYDHGDCEGYDEGCGDGTEKEGGEEEYDSEGGAD